MQKKLRAFFVVTLIASLLMAACSTELSIEGQLSEDGNSGTIDLDLGTGNDSSSNGSNDSGSGQQNEQIVPTSDGFLILIGLGLLIMAGLVFGLMSQNRANR